MPPRPTFSLIVPTRQRPAQLGRFLDSLAATAARPEAVEVVLVIDADDPASSRVAHGRLALKRVVVPPGLTMGALNTAGYEASSGAFLMLLNDDVVARTWGWDDRIRACFRRVPDGIALVHPNDTLLRDHLCTFPVVSRTFCRLAGGICPREYLRYRIDDHIEDIFNLLAVLGERRVFYLPDVVFEHRNAVALPQGGWVYLSDPAVLALDAPRFEALFAERKELAIRLREYVAGGASPAMRGAWRGRLEMVTDSFALRVPGRQRLDVRSRLHQGRDLAAALVRRGRNCVRQKGYFGLVRALARRLIRPLPAAPS
jgi:glycosyltransferase involved in cell wall biosynthesis